jgi:hypothetical protein
VRVGAGQAGLLAHPLSRGSPGRIIPTVAVPLPPHPYEVVAHKRKVGELAPCRCPIARAELHSRAVARRYHVGAANVAAPQLPRLLPPAAALASLHLPTCFVLVNVHRLHSRGRESGPLLRCCMRPADPALCRAWLEQFQHTTEPSRTLSRIVHSLLNEPGLYLHPVRPGKLITEPATSSL